MDERAQHLLEAYLADVLTDEEKAELTAWLDADPSHRAAFREATELEYFLHAQLQEEAGPADVANQAARKWRWTGRNILGVAAVALGVLTLLGTWWFDERPVGTGDSESVAKITGVSDDAAFGPAHDLPRRTGGALSKGWVRLDKGSVELEFQSGARVTVLGPSVFGIDSATRGFLESGEVRVLTPENAQGFAIGTPQMEVVDLGTRFRLRVDPKNKAEVQVDEGLVELHLGGGGTPRKIQTLPAGLRANISADGELLSLEGAPLDPAFARNAGLLARWKLDGVAADGTVRDASAHGWHAVFQGKPASATTSGRVDGALALSAGQAIDISPVVPQLARSKAFTFAAWVKDLDNMIFSFSDGTSDNRIQFEKWGNQLIYGWQQGGSFDAVGGKASDWNKGDWHHVAVTVSGREVTIYLNGTRLVSRATGQRVGLAVLAPSDLTRATKGHLGLLPANHNGKPQWMDGQIDDVQIYGRALDEAAIEDLFEQPGAVNTEFPATQADNK